MTDRRVALLRGINIGKAKRVAMADLRALVEGLGYTNVTTLLNSGNVVFTAPPRVRGDAAARIERAVASSLGVSSRVAVLTGPELDAVVEANPLLHVADNPSRLQVAVLYDADAVTALKPLLKARLAPEVLALGPRAAYVWCPAGVIDSQALKAIGRAVADRVTVRTWSTILKLQKALST
jgi:uncharacterized protein (DUF1697 family)